MSKEYWGEENSSWGDSSWGDSWEEEEDVIVDVEYEVDDDEDITYEKNVNSRKRKICKKGLFYGISLFFLGIGNALFKSALKEED